MIRVVLTTFATAEDAAKAVRILVDEQIIACGTILPGARSIYRWKDAIEDSAESLGPPQNVCREVSRTGRRLRAIHPYETPEIIALDPVAVSRDYAAWVIDCCGGVMEA